jgi:hypothetical protein
MSISLYPGLSLSLYTYLLSYPYTLLHTSPYLRYVYVQSFTCTCYLPLRAIFVLTYMSFSLYPGPSYVPTYCLTVIPLSTFSPIPSYTYVQSFTFLPYTYLLSPYLASLLHVSIFSSPAYPLSCIRTYCHTRMLTTHSFLLTYVQSFTFFSLLAYLAYVLTCLIYCTPALSTYRILPYCHATIHFTRIPIYRSC